MPQAFAGAWPLPAGQGQAIATISGQAATRSFDSGGKPDAKIDYNKAVAELYLEHGLTDNLTLILNAGAETVSIGGADRDLDAITGFSAAKIAIQRTLKQTDSGVFSVQAGLVIGQDGENVPGLDLGLGGTDFEIGALAGKSGKLLGIDVFAQAHMAYRLRGEGFGNETRLDLSTGAQIYPRYQLFLQSFYAKGQANNQSFAPYERFKIQPSLTYQYVYNGRLQFGVSQTVSGENSLQDTAVFVGIWRRY